MESISILGSRFERGLQKVENYGKKFLTPKKFGVNLYLGVSLN